MEINGQRARCADDMTPYIRISFCDVNRLQLTENEPSQAKPPESYNPFEKRIVEHPNSFTSQRITHKLNIVLLSAMSVLEALLFLIHSVPLLSDTGSLVHLLKCSLGTGILAMPHAFRNAGLVFGTVVTVLVGLVCTHCIHILVRSSQILCLREKIPVLTFAETAEVAFKSGPTQLKKLAQVSKQFVNVALCATCYSTSCVYIVFVATSIKQVTDHYYQAGTADDAKINIRLYILMIFPFVCALGLIRNLKYLVPVSAIANLLMGVGFTITFYYIFTGVPSPTQRDYVASPGLMPMFFCTVIFAMEGIGVVSEPANRRTSKTYKREKYHIKSSRRCGSKARLDIVSKADREKQLHNVMPLENSMKNPGHFLGCPGVLNAGMFVVVTLYAIIGFFGYLKYGESTNASVTLNLPSEHAMAQVVKILIAVAILFTYGLQFFIATDITWPMLEKHVDKRWSSTLQNLYRILTVAITVCVAIAVPNLGPIISLVGAVCYSTLGLLCPVMIDLVTNWEGGLGTWYWVLWKDSFIILFWLAALLTGTYTSVLDIITMYS
uniref:Amino acid transporter transmembrane domain-containing protein n=1 Tax=Timema tahoe TaxID=61484 RepID=A0A7R9IAF9_9NEOP|nr:unnamed protein product [Timema tahoe]